MAIDHLLSLFGRFARFVMFAAVLPASALELQLDTTLCNGANPTRLSCDISEHLLYVTSPFSQEILVYNGNDALVNTIPVNGVPGALCLTGNGTLIVSIDRSVREITTAGDELITFGLNDNYFVAPHDVEWLPDGKVCVADEDDSIKVFDAAGTPLYSFAGWGYVPAKLDEPVALDYNPQTNELLVCDQNNYRLKSFTPAGTFVRYWGTERNEFLLPGSYFRPFGLDIDPSGRIWSLETIDDIVYVYDNAGLFLYSAEIGPLAMRGGIDLAVDANRLFVSSPSTGCVYVYTIVGGSPPGPATSLDLTILWTDNGAQLNWRERTGVTAYHIERSQDTDFSALNTEEIAATPDTFYLDDASGLPATQYYYRVWADPMLVAVSGDFSGNARPDWPYRESLDQPHDAPHHGLSGVNCHSCHFRGLEYPEPMPAWWRSDHICLSCHVETGFAQSIKTHLGSDTLSCSICHNPHFQQEQYAHYLIRNTNPLDENEHMYFNHATDFIHGAPNYDGICEICHTQTEYYRNDGTGDEHQVGENCLNCHSHKNGFMPLDE